MQDETPADCPGLLLRDVARSSAAVQMAANRTMRPYREVQQEIHYANQRPATYPR